MGNIISSEDNIEDPTSSPTPCKKMKLNDESAQDSFTERPSGSKDEKEENVGSGVSADKSESTSSDDRATTSAEAFLNEVVSVASSSNNVKAMELDIRRSVPDRGLEDSSSQDSEDLSIGVETSTRQADTSDGVSNTEFFNATSSIYSFDSASVTSTESYMILEGPTGDTDSDEDTWFYSNWNENKQAALAILSKTRPKHNYLMLREVINRELGLPVGKAVQTNVMFEQKFYGSLHAVYRLEKLHNLLQHRGSVNSIHFNPDGRLLASGADDLNVIVWDWAKRTALQTIETGHICNLLQCKFMYLNAQSQINIVTCGRDGQVRLLSMSPSGTSPSAHTLLAEHVRAARSLHVWPAEPHLVLSAGEDSLVLCSDVRTNKAVKMIHVKTSKHGSDIALYSVAGHPMRNQEVLLAGRDRTVRVYDTRRAAAPLAIYRPERFRDKMAEKSPQVWLTMHLTCAEYNYDGSEILASYNDEDIYLFNTKNDVLNENTSDEKDGYTHRYSGHRSTATYKANYGATFFGPKSEYIVSGSNCSYIYMWEKKSEAIVQWMIGEDKGAVNCIETHPRFPIMATSGVGKDVKIWIPKGEADPTYDGIEKVVCGNREINPLFQDFLPTSYNPHRGSNRVFSDGDIEFDDYAISPL